LTDGENVVTRENSYFNRSTFAFSSHRHTPNDPATSLPAAVIGRDGGYISACLFEEYAAMGSLIAKLILTNVIDRLLGDEKTLTTDLPAQGVVTLMNQTAEKRLVNHILYASPVRRGSGIEIIEDIIPLYHVNVAVKTGFAPRRVYLAPEMQDIPYTYENGRVAYTVDKLDCHAMVVLEY